MSKIDLGQHSFQKGAVVFSGGVVKAAAWHLGVSLALEELGIRFYSNKTGQLSGDNIIQTYVGSSAGAFLCTLLAAGFSPREITNSFLGIKKSPLKRLGYKDIFSLEGKRQNNRRKTFSPLEDLPTLTRIMLTPFYKFNGLFSTYGLKKYLLNHVLEYDRFEDFAPDLFIVATQLDHSRKVVFGRYNYPNPRHDSTTEYYTGTHISDAAAASMSVPPFFSPFPIKNDTTNVTDFYIDGEIRETLSTHIAEDNGCDFIISSWTHTPYHYQSEIGSLVKFGLPAIALQSIYLLIQKKIVSSRAYRSTSKDLIDAVHQYMTENKFSAQHIQSIIDIIERKLEYRSKATLVDIYPTHDDYKLFFASSFSLHPKTTSYIVKMGYRRTFEVLGHI